EPAGHERGYIDMKWFFKPCDRYRQSICLLASDALPDEERAQAQDHLASCAECRKYFDQIKAVTAPLGNWERSFAQIQASPTLQMRWTKAISAEAKGEARERLSIQALLHRCSRELLLPVRWHLAGMGALWMIAA